jgi:metal-sulfur cluster biosynthetic enzyme
MALGRDEILEALKRVYDPEIPVDIVNLGLVYDICAESESVHVKITTTATGCPVANYIAGEIKRVIHALAESGGEPSPEVTVETVYDPPWSMEKMSEEGRRILGWE